MVHNSLLHDLVKVMSQVMRMPGAGVGIAIMVNDNEFGTDFYKVVQKRIVDHIFGLEPVD
jgi:hypothetical protein